MLWFGSHSLLNCICRLMVGCSYRGRWMVTGLSTAFCTTSWPPFWAFLSSSICSAELQSGQRSTQEWGWEKLTHPHGLHWQGFTQEDEKLLQSCAGGCSLGQKTKYPERAEKGWEQRHRPAGGLHSFLGPVANIQRDVTGRDMEECFLVEE